MWSALRFAILLNYKRRWWNIAKIKNPLLSIIAVGTIDKKLIYRKRKKGDDVKRYTKTVNPDLPGQQTQKGFFKEAILEWKTGGYSSKDIEAWNLYARANRKAVSGFNMFAKFKIAADIESKTWERLTNCNIYDVTGVGFKVDINVNSDHSGKLYIGTSKLSMLKEVTGVFSVDKYKIEVTGLSPVTKYYFFIKNTSEGKRGRTGIYSQKTTLKIPIIIDIGELAIKRASIRTSEFTFVNKGNPANETGTIKSVEIWANQELIDCRVATFYVVSGNNLSTRDWEQIGKVTAGSKKTFNVNIDVQAGDYIGIWYWNGYIETDFSGYSGVWQAMAKYIPCINKGFALAEGDAISLFGIGSD